MAGVYFKRLRAFGLHRFPRTNGALAKIGILPIRRHYYEPLVYAEDLRRPLSEERAIPGLDLNVPGQLALLAEFEYANELRRIPLKADDDLAFGYHNGMFESGDAEYLYNVIRHFRPQRIVEIGAGQSTLMMRIAIEANQQEDPSYDCDHVCIEPFENAWLERCGARVIRKPVETCEVSVFQSLGPNDVLFIDSSHVIRPQGDVIYEYLEVLGPLSSGVLIQAHDIFTPRDYPEAWVLKEHRLWNEQYLLEAFLSYNHHFEIIGALNYLWHNYPQEVGAKCPILASEPYREPGSFWFRKL